MNLTPILPLTAGRTSTVPSKSPSPAIIGRSQAMAKLLADLERLAQSDAKVLIIGETGVGKDMVASAIHAASRRADRLFVAVNCAGLPETLLESELFGHKKGSFTGAYRDRAGKFELAHGGTLFLDEVGEMTPRMQSLLLRVLETGELQKVGADRWAGHVDARVIAATNRNLPDLIHQGLFREDLYYRLNVIRIHVPPLRERREDIPLLADAFLRRLSNSGEPSCRFSPDFYEALQAYSWPGNVRQLENVVERLVIHQRDVITAADLPRDIRVEVDALVRQPTRERRRPLAELLYDRLRTGASFWDIVYQPFMDREITRSDVRAVVQKGLEESRGNYRGVTRLFNIDASDYKRFLSFLRKHECRLPYRDFR